MEYPGGEVAISGVCKVAISGVCVLEPGGKFSGIIVAGRVAS